MAESDPPVNPLDDHDSLPPSMDPELTDEVQEPPTTFRGTLGALGPGLIIAAAIVGSGELIATTKTGAQAGISLLWLVILGCVVKTFVQIELGRYAISHGETTLTALDRVPGPRLKVNWIVWFWVLMTAAGLGQLGGIVGGVGQALALTVPITGDYETAIEQPSEKRIKRYLAWQEDLEGDRSRFDVLNESQQQRVLMKQQVLERELDAIGERGDNAVALVAEGKNLPDPFTRDDRIYAVIIAVLTSWLLYYGRYLVLQRVSLFLVGGFTIITVVNVIGLQLNPDYALSLSEIFSGMTFSLPEPIEDVSPLTTALATFGIIGVGAAELVSYPYWCIEKGYAKFAGKRDGSPDWIRRARGWQRIMSLDAYASTVLFTIATLLFYIMGVAVLYKQGLDPEGMRMVATLAEAYVPIFGNGARWLFLIGAVAVLYSTYMAANAANTRMFTDGLKILGVIPKHSESAHNRSVKTFAIVLPLLCAAIYCMGADPVQLILISGVMQLAMLPLLALSALYFRYTRTDPALKLGRGWDFVLILSCFALMLTGAWGIYSKLF